VKKEARGFGGGLSGTVEVCEGLAVLQKCLQIGPHIYQLYESPCKKMYS
jgi:hypothetical protein